MTDRDIIVLDGGLGGYIAAERLGHVRKNMLFVEVSSLGDICLNVGCIPTKTLLGAAKTHDHARHRAQFGMKVGGAHVDWPVLQKWKDRVVSTLAGGVTVIEKKTGITVMRDHGTSDGPGKVTIDGTTHTATHVILTIGSVPMMSPTPGTKDNPLVIDSTDALSLPEILEHPAVTGDDVIEVEFASLYSVFGTQITAIETLPRIVPFADDDVAVQLRKVLKDVIFKLGCQVTFTDGGKVNWITADGAEESVEADYVLMAAGRRPVAGGWGAEDIGLEYSGRGAVVDDRIRTNPPNVWATGDVTGRSLLAHAAYRMGEVTAANILNPEVHRRGEVMRWHTVPRAVYTAPECAGIGSTEAVARKVGCDVITASVPGCMSGRSAVEDGLQAPGLAKLILDAETRQVLGIHVLGSYTAETTWGAPAMLETELDLTDLHQLAFPRPAASELIYKAAWTAKA